MSFISILDAHMTLWSVLTVVSIVIMIASWIHSKIYNESIDVDYTLSGLWFDAGLFGMLIFGALTLLSGSITILCI